ncbi:hypothetical protein, partial [Saccharopolyspora cebuensis]|uniref:hypothetical protein n=1 Tax=Saccharopolyspora cebuensis TaxID=418759 RepID=UPI0031E5E31D
HMIVDPNTPDRPLGLYVYDRWSEAADALLESHRTTAVVARATEQWWDLQCAAADCNWVLVEMTMRYSPDRAELVELAGGCRWRRIDNSRWLCDRCSHSFAPADCL